MTNTLPKITLLNLFHRNNNHIGLKFKYNDDLLSIIRDIPHARWSKTHRLWYIPLNEDNLMLIKKRLNKNALVDFSKFNNQPIRIDRKRPKRERQLSSEQKLLLNNFYKYLKGKRYSKSTVDTYTFFAADFIEFHRKKDLEELNNRDVELFIESIFIKRNYSISTQRQFISAIKLFVVFCPEIKINNAQLTRPKKSKKLPIVLSHAEILKLIQTAKNLKHRVVIALLYSSGLRISELLNLKTNAIDLNRNQILILNAKGRKDRYVGLSEHLKPLLGNYINTYNPKMYFIEGRENDKYSTSSVRHFLIKYAKEAKISKRVSPHTLRHSYATHLLEQGVGMRYIQELLGHSRPETTMIYTHVAKKDLLDIKSPLDYAISKYKKQINVNNNSHYPGKLKW